MALGCGAKVLKYCLFAFNLIFLIAGVLCLGVGIYLIVDDHSLAKLSNIKDSQGKAIITDSNMNVNAVHNLGIILAVGGAIILVIAFFGCCGAVKEWRPLLVLYAICLMVILAVEIAAAIYAAINRKSLESDIQTIMTKTLANYNGTAKAQNDARTVWDTLMNNVKCCGVNDLTYVENTTMVVNEFKESLWYKEVFSQRYQGGNQDNAARYFPKPCCMKGEILGDDVVIQANLQNETDPVCVDRYKNGCYNGLKSQLESRLSIVIGVGIGVGLIQLIGIIFSFCLCRAITDEYVG